MTQSLRFALFFVLLALLLVALNVYVHRRVSKTFALGAGPRRVFGALLATGGSGMVLSRVVPGGAARFVAGAASLVELAVLVAAILLLAEHALVVTARVVLRRRAASSSALAGDSDGSAQAAPLPVAPGDPPASRTVLSRRELLARASASAVMAIGAGSAAYGGVRGRHDYVVEEVPIRLARLPRALDGFTIAQLSDLHLGLFVGDDEMATALDLVRRARPDLVAITGDMVDHQVAYADDLGRWTRMLGAVAPVVVVPGNHDHYAGVGTVLERVHRAGGEVLLNRSLRIGEGRIVVAGVDDLWARRFRMGRGPDLDAALADASDDAPRILLAHQPSYFEEASERVDLQLSGHTHGGQFNLGFRPADLVLPHGWVAGLYRVGDAQLYVNRGFGTAGPPARLGAAPEVSRIVLTV